MNVSRSSAYNNSLQGRRPRPPNVNNFFLGDYRDNNNDSRYIGPVEKKLLIGSAHHVAVSLDTLGSWLPRWGRTGEKIR